MDYGYSAQAIQQAEAPLLARGIPLMQRAALALHYEILNIVRELSARGKNHVNTNGARVVVLIGSGNNGGDALFAAAHLARKQLDITVIVTGSRVHSEGMAAVRQTQSHVIDVAADPLNRSKALAACHQADVIVDGILGIGASGSPRGVAGDLISEIAMLHSEKTSLDRAIVVAVDMPTGVDASTGRVTDPERVLRADVTVTFGARKVGQMLTPGREYVGEVRLVPIGLELASPQVQSITDDDFSGAGLVNFLCRRPRPTDHKYTRGVTGIIAGSCRFPGAARLATHAALRSGIGMVRYLGEPEVARSVVSSFPEVVTAPGRVQSWLVGSGMLESDRTRHLVLDVIARDEPAILDAGALLALRHQDVPLLAARHVLTPHAGELAALLSRLVGNFTREKVETDPLTAAQLLHEATHATVVAKGSTTIVVSETATWAQNGGTSRLATAGSGDVLAGILAAALASHQASADLQTSRPRDTLAATVAAGIHLHSVAGNIAAGELNVDNPVEATGLSQPITATDIVTAIPRAHAHLAR